MFLSLYTYRKKFKLGLLALLCPLLFYGQTLTGLWVGSLSSDSNTVRKDQSFEIALTEYRGKVYGYSRSEFIVNDTLYYILKRVKGTIDGDHCEVVDDEIISYNFPTRLDKGVKVVSTFYRNQKDSTWYLAGNWKTTATKKYYAVSGKIDLEQEKDLSASKIFPHLEELNLANDIAFYKDREISTPIVRIAKPEKVRSEYVTKGLSQQDVSVASPDQPMLSRAEAEIIPEKAETQTNVTGLTRSKPVTNTPVAPSLLRSNSVVPVNTTVDHSADLAKTNTTTDIPVAKTQVTVTAAPVKTNPISKVETANVTNKKNISSAPGDPKTIPVIANSVTSNDKAPELIKTVPEKAKPDVTLAAAVIQGRKSEFSQEVNFHSDSLELSLYDNGEIDGDTVSVYMNGEVLMSRQGLKASAIRKTIYLKPGQDDDFTLVLFAENLGKYPPNTGLLVVHDGDDIYNLRFSSDFQKNAGIVFRRKKN